MEKLRKKLKEKLTINNILEFTISLLSTIIIFGGATKLDSYRLYLVILLGALIFGWGLLNRKKDIFRINRLTIMFSIVILIVTISIIYSINYKATLKYIAVFIVCLLLLVVKLPKNVYKTILNLMVIFSIVIAITIILSVFIDNFILKYFNFLIMDAYRYRLIKEELRQGIYSGILCEKGYASVAMYIGITVISSIMLVTKKIKIKNVVGIAILLVGLLLTGKKMLFAITIFNAILIYFIYNKNASRKKILILSLFMVIIAVLALMFIPETQIMVQRFIKALDDPTLTGRTEYVWNYAIQMFEETPIIGMGFGTFPNYLLTIRSNDIFHAHNNYLQLLGEVGIIGTIVFITFFAYSLYKCFNVFINTKRTNNKQNEILAAFSLNIQLWFLIYGITGCNLYYYHQLLVYILAIAIMMFIETDLLRRKNNE